jgi:hypothetical protein
MKVAQRKIAHNEQIYCEQKLLNKFAQGESNLLKENQCFLTENHELPFILLEI